MEKIISIYNNEKYLKLIKDCKKSFITQDKDDKFIYTYIEILYIHVNKLLNNSDDYQKLTDIKNKINTITCLLLLLSFFYNNNFIINEANTKDFDIYTTIINILKLLKLKDENLEKIRELLINLNNNKDKIKNILDNIELQITSDIKTDVFNEDFIKSLKKIVLPDESSKGGADGADGSGADGSGADGSPSNASSVVADGSGADTTKTTDQKQEVESINESNEMERIKIIFQIKIMHDLFMLSNEDIDIIKKLSLN